MTKFSCLSCYFCCSPCHFPISIRSLVVATAEWVDVVVSPRGLCGRRRDHQLRVDRPRGNHRSMQRSHANGVHTYWSRFCTHVSHCRPFRSKSSLHRRSSLRVIILINIIIIIVIISYYIITCWYPFLSVQICCSWKRGYVGTDIHRSLRLL